MNINKIINIDIIIMVVFIAFSFVWISTPHLFYPFYKYYLFVIFIYIFSKCIFGIIIILNKLKTKDKIKKSKKYILCILPSIMIIGFYIWFVISTILLTIKSDWGIDYQMAIEAFFFIPFSEGFDRWFPSINLNIVFNILMLIGLLMWVIYWTFYNKEINKKNIVLLNIITPISIIFLFFEILGQFSK